MSAILFAPHGDDETLFAFYTLLREKPHVVVVLQADELRRMETAAAMMIADVTWTQMPHQEDRPVWGWVADQLRDIAADFDTVIAPAWEEGGHEHHNAVALAVPATMRYFTYKRGFGRSELGTEVIPTVEEKALKIEALNCYRSQRLRADTAVWFGDDQREFIL